MTIRFPIEKSAWILGFLLLGVYAVVQLHGRIHQRADLTRFQEARESIGELASATASPEAVPLHAPPPVEVSHLEVDQADWSPGRIDGYNESLQADAGPAIAVLRIPTIDLEVAVLSGTDDVTLNRAVGHIEGTAWPGQTGNVGLAGHRDGFFRGLKDVGPGDPIELLTATTTESWIVDEIRIISPEEVEVLQPTEAPTLTLVTCYPFYFIGSAPERYIVRAIPAPSAGPDGRAVGG